jgi:hypothetical protein
MANFEGKIMNIYYVLIRSETDDCQMCQLRGLASSWQHAGSKALDIAEKSKEQGGEGIKNPYICELRFEGKKAF